MFNYKSFLVLSFILINGLVVMDTVSRPLPSTPQSIRVTNNTDHALNVNLSVPEQTEVLIKLKRLAVLQDALHQAIIVDSAKKIKKVLLDGANPNQLKDGKSPLFWTTLYKCHNAVEMLLQWGVRPDDVCVQEVIRRHDTKVAFLLLKFGQINFDLKVIFKIFLGCSYPRSRHLRGDVDLAFDLIKELVNRGYDINAMWELAIGLRHNKEKCEEAIRFLLLRGANPNHVFTSADGCTETPLLNVLRYCREIKTIGLLLKSGADINQTIMPYRDHKIYTPLAHTIEHCGEKEVIEFLLENGAVA